MKLQFTNGYRPRFDQITRILQFLLTQEGRKKIPREDIVAALGIPNNQVENLISMMTGFGLVNPRVTTLTPLGRTIILADPYFEKIETLWIIHYMVSGNPKWIVWHRIVNQVIPSQDHFEVDKITSQYFSDLVIHFSERTLTEKLPLEVGAVLSAYTRSELSRLNILSLEGTGSFIRSNPVEIPGPAFLFCLLHFRDQFSPGSSAMNIEDICQAENSPGRVLNLPEYQVRALLGELHNAGLVRMEQFANLDQIRLLNTITPEYVLEGIYRGSNAG